MVEIVIKSLDTNADFVLFIEWLVPDGARVSVDAPVCVVETSKTAVQIEAPAAGILKHCAQPGEKVAVGAVVATISEQGGAQSAPRPAAAPSVRKEERISRKARELMLKHGIEERELSADGFVTAADVEQVVAQRLQKAQLASGGIFRHLDGLDTQGVTFPEGSADLSEGRMDPGFLAQVREKPDAMRSLGENERLALLRKHGAAVGRDVRLGEGTLVYAPQIVLRDEVSIAAGGTVWCAERFIAGPLARFGPRLQLRCQQAVVGAGVIAGTDIIIGGGGNRDPWAVISIGDECYLGDWLFLNTCRPILIGRNVFVTNRVTLLTHNIGHSYIDGYENRFAPLVLEDTSQVGINCVVYAGARVGRGAVVGSNGYVIDSIPPGKMALGVPARVVGDAQRTLTPQRKEARVREILGDLRKLLLAKGCDVVSPGADDTLEVRHEGRQFGIAFRPGGGSAALPESTTWVVWTLGAAEAEARKGVVTIDIARQEIRGEGDLFWTDTVREYLRKRGIKLQPGPWRYRGGMI